MLLRTRLTLLFALTAAVLVLAFILVLTGWQQAQDARFHQALIDVQHVSWRKIEASARDSLQRRAAELAADGSLAEALRQGSLEAWLPRLRAAGLALDLYDAGGQLLYTSSTSLSPDTLLDLGAVRHLLGSGQASVGLTPTAAGSFAFVAAQPVYHGGRLVGGLALGQDVDAALTELAHSLGAEVALFNLRGHADKGNGAERLRRLGAVLSLRRDSVVEASLDGRDYLATGIPVEGHDGRQAGGVATLRDVTDQRNRERLLIVGVAGGAALFIAALLIGLFMHLRQAFAPLGRALDVLTALSRGDTSVRLDVDSHDEAGQIAAGVARLRSELINLEILREERQRERRRQTRIIRDEMRALAGTLDADARAEILADLEAALAEHEEGEGDNQLAVLAFVLARLSERIRGQQVRLLRLVADLNEALKTKEAFVALRQELEIARRMQQSVLPRVFPERDDVQVASFMLPAKEVGGDFYDYFLLDERRLGVVIADVSGKGVPAAFFMAISRTLLKVSARFLHSPAECLERVNNLLAAENEEMMFVTVFYGVLELDTGRFTYASGGHNPPVLLGADGAARFLERPAGMALAVMEDMPYAEATIQLGAGDVVFMYTDGVTEALDPEEALFGDAALLATVEGIGRNDAAPAPVATYQEGVVAALQTFARGAPQADDITCVTLRFHGQPASAATPD